jgi:UDP-2,4-diacetamido-2,4,6-trideoxy-beta-L-altropyranose hydrolase
MKILFRVDSSLLIGTGHTMRCLTLAEVLREKNVEVSFVTHAQQGNLNDFLKQKGYKVYSLTSQNDEHYRKNEYVINNEENGSLSYTAWLAATWQEDAAQTKNILKEIKPDWLIVDHYAIDYRWHQFIKPFCRKLMVIDDLANRKHNCDLLLDQTHGRKDKDYHRLVPNDCTLLLGSKFALLRPEFSDWREYSLKRRKNPEIKQIIITLGGIDKDNITSQVIEALKECSLSAELEIAIVMGGNAPHIDNIKNIAEQMPCKTQVLTNIENIAEYMAKSDLAIGAAGSTTWERCCLGLPTLMVITADNQKNNGRTLEKNRAVILITKPIKNSVIKIFSELTDKVMQELSTNSVELVDGMGCARVVDKITAII